MNMAADLIPRFDGREAYWWLIQAEQYIGSRRMSEEMKLEWAVAFALRGDALDWWISCKESHPNTCWWNFVKAILKKFQPEVWDCLLESENETWEIQGSSEIQEPIALPTEEKIGGKVDDSQVQQYSEKEVYKADIKSDCESDKVKNTDSLMAASEAKVQRSDRELVISSHAKSNKKFPKIKSRNKKFPLPVPLLPQQVVTKGLPLASKFDSGGNFLFHVHLNLYVSREDIGELIILELDRKRGHFDIGRCRSSKFCGIIRSTLKKKNGLKPKIMNDVVYVMMNGARKSSYTFYEDEWQENRDCNDHMHEDIESPNVKEDVTSVGDDLDALVLLMMKNY
ncbi:unnamed protein product [Vicia faba]|uniref:Uncharacterized protein n=1 Tax=Vicia faba TaxID=3906 RepID=A0AAV1AHX1_VICFA|nr:unnamed protein product [Vicia faba]